ncbi:uncharacterized protein LOC123518052 isoform X1 [Portunus trituberculatus]|uniref:uncharacterized protein LOC123518052 isoform X1 n=1 Tax=Portunus trituberculatus TaxID=210409 RepID=UPI001E1CDC67|nr:uncharacterized protein LOC123518052 isoform X1 [Portunus trituberculatus]XP_045134539.1 uncharacterized protein LOC123518052 isoform X1 [Portunus trituberculatus]
MIHEWSISSAIMTVLSMVRCGLMLWTILKVAGTSQSSEGKVPVAGTLESPPSVEDDTNNFYLPSSQQNTGSLPAWAVSAVASLSTHSLTDLPWWTSLTATTAIRLDEGRRVPDSSPSLPQNLVSRSSPSSVSVTSPPHVLPMPLKPRHKPSSPDLAKDSKLLQDLHSSHPHLLFGNKNKDEKKNYNNKENKLQNGQMKNETDLSERRKRASVGTYYDIPVSVVSYSPTSHFFMHELLHPQPTLGQKSVLDLPQYFKRNLEIQSSSSAPIVFPGATTAAMTTTTSSPLIVFPTKSTFPSTMSHNVTLPITTSNPGLQEQGLSSTSPTPPDPFVTDNRVIIVAPCRGFCKISVGRVCVTDFNCLARHPGK